MNPYNPAFPYFVKVISTRFSEWILTFHFSGTGPHFRVEFNGSSATISIL